MSVTARLVFDSTDADTRAASSNVGAYVRAGDDGTVIGHVSDALKVSIANASLSVTQGTSPWVIGDGGGSITVDATDLDIRDLTAASDSVASWTKDGAGNSIGSTSGALNVAITSGFVDVDDSLANTSIENESRTVGTSAITTTAAAALANRRWLYLCNTGNRSIWFGKAGITAADGFPVYPGDKHEFRIGAAVTTNVIADAAGQDLRVMQLS